MKIGQFASIFVAVVVASSAAQAMTVSPGIALGFNLSVDDGAVEATANATFSGALVSETSAGTLTSSYGLALSQPVTFTGLTEGRIDGAEFGMLLAELYFSGTFLPFDQPYWLPYGTLDVRIPIDGVYDPEFNFGVYNVIPGPDFGRFSIDFTPGIQYRVGGGGPDDFSAVLNLDLTFSGPIVPEGGLGCTNGVDGFDCTFDTVEVTISSAAIPLPAGFWLLGSGIGLLAARQCVSGRSGVARSSKAPSRT